MNGGDSNLGGPQALPTPPTQLSPTPPSRDSSPILEVPHEGKTSSRPFTIKVETPDDVTSKPEASLDASQTTNDSAPAPSAAPVETTKAEVAPTPAPLAEPSAMPAVDVLPRSEADRGVGAASAISDGIDNSAVGTATNSTTATATGAVNIAAGAGTIGVSNVGNTSVATGAMGAAGNIEGGVNMGVIAGNGAIPSTGFPANTIANTGVVPGTVVPANAYVDEDIVLNNQPAKKPKKWIIIGVIVALVLLTVIAAMALIGENQLRSDGYGNLFNKHANQLLFGEEAATAIDNTLVIDETYAFDCEEITNSECKDLFYVAAELLESFLNASYKENLPQEMLTEIDQYRTTFDDYYGYINMERLSDDDILSYYVSNGYEETIDYINNVYANLTDGDNSFLASCANYELKKALFTAKTIDEANSAGCLVEKHYNQDCISNLIFSNEVTAEFIDLQNNQNYINNINRKRNDILNGVAFISNYLYNAGEKE